MVGSEIGEENKQRERLLMGLGEMNEW